MKLSVNWLKDYIDPKLSTEELVNRLTMAGMAVERRETIGGDVVLELEVTPNRPDCLNVLGLAREIGAMTGKAVKYPKVNKYGDTILNSGIKYCVPIFIEDKKDCGRYVATLIRGARIADAPQHMKARLEAVGIRPVNNAVDTINFVLMETGQPLHVFDYDQLAGGQIIVRRAKAGESLVTIDGVERKLDTSILVIADAQKPVAIAGIMGGKASEVTSSTRNILLESAHFDMGLIRRACRALGLRSESSYRFERNVAMGGVLTAANRAVDLLLTLTNGQFAARNEVAGSPRFAGEAGKPALTQAPISVATSEIVSLLGIKITTAQAKAHLERLKFKVSAKRDVLTVVAPEHRMDITQSVDVIEEIARMIGFDRLPSKLPVIKAAPIAVDGRPREVRERIRAVLTACGASEVITYAMTNTKALAKCGLSNLKAVRVFNPLNQEQELMRPALLPSLLQVALTNINRGQRDLRFFEIGKRYALPAGAQASGEKDTLAVLLAGRRHQDWRADTKEPVDIFDLKGALESLFSRLGAPVSFDAAPGPSFDNACAAVIRLNGRDIGAMGKVDGKVLSQWGIKIEEVYFAEVDLEPLMHLPRSTIKYQPISEFPPIVRDVSLAVKKEILYAQVEAVCRAHGGAMLKSVHFIEQYLGDKIHLGDKGLVFSLVYQSNSRTLREEEVSVVHQGIIQALMGELHAVLR